MTKDIMEIIPKKSVKFVQKKKPNYTNEQKIAAVEMFEACKKLNAMLDKTLIENENK